MHTLSPCDYFFSRNSNWRPTLLIGDSSPESLTELIGKLQVTFKVVIARDSDKIASLATTAQSADILLLDTDLKGIGGFGLCRLLSAQPHEIVAPIVLMSSKPNRYDESLAIELGAVDYFAKPLPADSASGRLIGHYNRFRARVTGSRLICKECSPTLPPELSLQLLQSTAFFSLPHTKEHCHRTQRYVKALAQAALEDRRFRGEIAPPVIGYLYHGAGLHDIGLFRGVFSPELQPAHPRHVTDLEYRNHPLRGFEIIDNIEAAHHQAEWLKVAKIMALSHHENYDGSGFPFGLKNDSIPLAGRIMAIGDYYDRLTSPTGNRYPLSHQSATNRIEQGCGNKFDPDLVRIFHTIAPIFSNILNLSHTPAQYQRGLIETGQTKPGRIAQCNPQGSPKILVVEDDSITRSMVSSLLRQEGYLVETARDGLHALTKLSDIANTSFCGILTDLCMPALNGYQLVLRIRKHNPTLPVIAFTSKDFILDRKAAIAAGFTDCIFKPFGENLTTTLSKHFREII